MAKRINLQPIIDLFEKTVSDAVRNGITDEDRREVATALKVYARHYKTKSDVWPELLNRLNSARTIFPGQSEWEATVFAVVNR